MLADHKDGLSSSIFLAWSSIAQSVCQRAFSLLMIWCLRPWWVRILLSAEEDNLSPFDSIIACLCQSIEINNNKHVCMCNLRHVIGVAFFDAISVAWSVCVGQLAAGGVSSKIIKIKPTNMYITSTRVQFKFNTHRCWNWHQSISDGLSVVQRSLGHVIGVAFFYTISVAWNVRSSQLAAGGAVSVWRSWVRSSQGSG